MATRKQTPDVLGEVLGGEPTPPKPAPRAEPRRAPSPRRTRKRTTPKRPQWEYMEVVFRDYGGYRPRCLNGEEQKGWKKAPVIFHVKRRRMPRPVAGDESAKAAKLRSAES